MKTKIYQTAFNSWITLSQFKTNKFNIKNFLFVLVLFLYSCHDKLNINPHSAISPEGITQDDIMALRQGMYNSVQNRPGRYAYVSFDITGGFLQTSSGNATDLINSTLSPLNGVITSSWSGYFKALYQVNNVLQILQSFGNLAEYKYIEGEALYFRAYIYSCLVTRWGDVPILKTNTLDLVSRDPVDEVWEFINNDLDKAIDLLGESKNYYYVSKNAALALKARVMLYENNLEEAKNIAEYLIEDCGFKLDSFDKIFRKKQNNEVIFAFENLTEESSIKISELFYNYAHPNKGSWVYRPTSELMSLYTVGDRRKSISVTTIGGDVMINKYPSGQTGTDPVVISRLAEMYLISAEAQGRQSGINRLNELRRFRGLADIHPTTDIDFIAAILQERDKEFVAENFRYYDYVRTGNADKISLLDYQQLYPISGKELTLNANLTQNPGY